MSDNQNNNNNLEAQCSNLNEENKLASSLGLLQDSNKAGASCSAPKKKGSKYEVYHGQASQTGGGLHKEDLMENKKGKIISKKRHEYGKKAFDNIKNYCNKDKQQANDCESEALEIQEDIKPEIKEEIKEEVKEEVKQDKSEKPKKVRAKKVAVGN